MSRQVPNGREGVVDRKMTFCERLQQYDQQRLVKTCKCCSKFFVHCCACDMGEWDKVTGLGFDGAQAQAVWEAAIANREVTNTTCHHYRLVFVKGLTINGGKENAVAGLGFAFGTGDEVQGSLVVDEEIDPSTISVTMQRAEILAGIEGLLALSCWDSQHEKKARRSKGRGSDVDDKNWVIATDSSSLVKGFTELLPEWKRKDGKDAEAVKPANLDLLETLHTAVVAEEAKQRVKIGVWKIPKEMNVVATLVARKALVKAANGQYTEAELAELGKNKRRAEPKKESEPGASKKTQSDSEMPPLEETSANTQVGKDAVGTNAKTMTTGSGPKDLAELMSKHLHMI